MKLRSLVASLVVALAVVFASATSAQAQGALYLNPVAIRISNSTIDNSTFSFLGPGTTSRIFYGVVFGGYYNIPQVTSKKLEVGVDLRDELVTANNAQLNSFMLGPRIAFKPFTRPIHPYVEPFVADGSSRAPHTSVRTIKLNYGVFVGADYEFSKHVSWRVAEVGYSSLITASSQTLSSVGVIPAAKLINFSTGLTFRLP